MTGAAGSASHPSPVPWEPEILRSAAMDRAELLLIWLRLLLWLLERPVKAEADEAAPTSAIRAEVESFIATY